MIVSSRGLFAASILGAVSLCVSATAIADTAYVTNDGFPGFGPSTVSVIDTGTNTVIRTINVGERPRTVAVNLQNRMVYVTNQGDLLPGSVSVIDSRSNTVVASIPVASPFGIATLGQRVYVAGNGDTVSAISTTTNTVIGSVTIPGVIAGAGANPVGLVITPSGARVYTANFVDSSVSVIDTASMTIVQRIALTDQPEAIAIDPAGTRVYTSNINTMSVIDTASNTVIATIPATATNGLAFPQGIAVNPAGTLVFVTNSIGGSVSVFSTATNGFVALIPAGLSPEGISFTGDGRRAYVADKATNSVHVIDATTLSPITDVPVGQTPISVGNFILPGCTNRHRLDFNGNGTTDFAVYRQPTGQWFNLQAPNVVFGVAGQRDIPVSEDYDGDCKADNAYWNPVSGTWNVIMSSTGATVTQQWGAANLGDIPSPGDFDGDGKTDFTVFRQSSGQWFIIQSSAGVFNPVFGVAGERDVPAPGDFDGDGRTDLAYWAPGSGNWNVLLSSTGATTVRNWGLGSVGDVPVPGDYDGDGRTDLAVFRQPTGQWFIISSATGGIISQVFGVAGQNDIPVPGDYDGDGRTDMAYWNPVSGTWNVRFANGTTTSQQWGSSAVGDIPLPAPPAYIRSHF